MKITENRMLDAAYSIIIPQFSQSEESEGRAEIEMCALMNLFYSGLAKEAAAYVKSECGHIRRYMLSYRAEEESSNNYKIEISISARVLENGGKIVTRRRILTQIWKNGTLSEHSFLDI